MTRTLLRALGAGVAGTIALMAAATPSYAAGTTTVRGGDYWFCDPSYHLRACTTTVQVGDTVVWDFTGSVEPHTATECGASCDHPTAHPVWDSGAGPGGLQYAFTFTTPGTYLYYCVIHPVDMRGEIVVEAVTPEATPPAEGTPPGATPTPRATATDRPTPASAATPAATATPSTGKLTLPGKLALPGTGSGPQGASGLAGAGVAITLLSVAGAAAFAASAAWYAARRRRS